MTKETVDHPDHYGGDTPYEVIKVLERWLTPDEFRGFCKGNVHKYLARSLKKGGVEDIRKAMWYLEYLSSWENRSAMSLHVGRVSITNPEPNKHYYVK